MSTAIDMEFNTIDTCTCDSIAIADASSSAQQNFFNECHYVKNYSIYNFQFVC